MSTLTEADRIEEIIAGASRRFKRSGIVGRGSDIPDIQRVSFGSIELDLATFGGSPVGRMTRPWGGWSSCKSMVTYQMVKQAQDLRTDQFPEGMLTVWHDIEGAYDKDYARDVIGLDVSRIIHSNLHTIEDICQLALESLDKAEIHVFDSVAHAFSQQRMEMDVSDYRKLIGSEARAWTPLLKVLEDEMDKSRNMIVLVDQIRKDIGGYKKEKEASSTAFDHASSLSMHHAKRANLYRSAPGEELVDTRPKQGNDSLTGGHVINGYEVEIEVNKSRVCRPFGKARLRLDLDTMRFDEVFEHKKAGIFLGVIQQSGAYYTIPTATKSIHGDKRLVERLEEDDKLMGLIYEAAMRFIAESRRV